jgi:hypothetical protein
MSNDVEWCRVVECSLMVSSCRMRSNGGVVSNGRVQSNCVEYSSGVE